MTSLAPLSVLDPIAGAQAASSAASAVSSAASSAASKVLFGGLTLSQVVIILMGILLIGAGLFSMEKTRTIIIGAGKVAGKAAAAAA